MVKATKIVQRVLGFSFLAFGLNGFVQAIPPLKMRNPALEFFLGLAATGYMLPLLYMTQAAAGAMLLVGLFVPLALAMLAPIVLNILLFHLFLAPAGIPVALLLLAFEVTLAWDYREAFAPMLRAQTVPDHLDRPEAVRQPVVV